MRHSFFVMSLVGLIACISNGVALTPELKREYAEFDVSVGWRTCDGRISALSVACFYAQTDYMHWLMQERHVRPQAADLHNVSEGGALYAYPLFVMVAMWTMLHKHGAPHVLDAMMRTGIVAEDEALLRAVVRRSKRIDAPQSQVVTPPLWVQLVDEQRRCYERALATYAAAKRRLGRDLACTLAQAVWNRRLMK